MTAHIARRRLCLLPLALCAAAATLPAAAQTAAIGQPAPGFELRDSAGKAVKLADFKGKFVVLEWTNPGCPFVVKHYGSQNMQALQKEATGQGVVWLSISSTAPGHSDYLAPAALAARYQTWGAAPAAMLMDDAGQVGRAYGARTTPHMYLIDPKGVLVYAGGIDDKRSANPADVRTATNLVATALGELAAGKAVTTAATTAYGCTIKY